MIPAEQIRSAAFPKTPQDGSVLPLNEAYAEKTGVFEAEVLLTSANRREQTQQTKPVLVVLQCKILYPQFIQNVSEEVRAGVFAFAAGC